jgi:hypothetical protein
MNLNVTTGVPRSSCPNCGKLFELASGPVKPSAGDFTICICCATCLKFNDDLTVRRLTPQEQQDADSNQYVRSVQVLIRASLAKRRAERN